MYMHAYMHRCVHIYIPSYWYIHVYMTYMYSDLGQPFFFIHCTILVEKSMNPKLSANSAACQPQDLCTHNYIIRKEIAIKRL